MIRRTLIALAAAAFMLPALSQEAFPSNSTPPKIRIRRVLVRDGLWVVESVVDYGGGQVMHGVAILELKNGKVWRDTRYFAEQFEGPKWRAQWVERMQT